MKHRERETNLVGKTWVRKDRFKHESKSVDCPAYEFCFNFFFPFGDLAPTGDELDGARWLSQGGSGKKEGRNKAYKPSR